MTRPWTDRYVGLPWKDRGRGPDGFDCWGLVREVLALERGVSLPDYGYASAVGDGEAARAVECAAPDWREVSRAEAAPFDVVLMRNGREPSHVAVYAGGGAILHVSREGATSSVARIDSPAVAPRVLGFFRWRGAP